MKKVTDIDQTLLAVFRDLLIFIYSLSERNVEFAESEEKHQRK